MTQKIPNRHIQIYMYSDLRLPLYPCFLVSDTGMKSNTSKCGGKKPVGMLDFSIIENPGHC